MHHTLHNIKIKIYINKKNNYIIYINDPKVKIFFNLVICLLLTRSN